MKFILRVYSNKIKNEFTWKLIKNMNLTKKSMVDYIFNNIYMLKLKEKLWNKIIIKIFSVLVFILLTLIYKSSLIKKEKHYN